MDSNTNNKKSIKSHKWLKRIGIIFLVFFMFMYIGSKIGISNIETNFKKTIVSSNDELTNQDLTIDNIKTSIYGDSSTIYNLTLNNPVNFNSPYAIKAEEVRLNSGFSSNPEIKNLIFTSIIFKNINIIYEINADNQINLYQTIDYITKLVTPNENFTPLMLLNSLKIPINPPLNYDGFKFYLGYVLIKKPNIYVYNNNKLIKTIQLDDITLKYNDIQQPMDYATALLAGSIQIIDKIDNAIGRK